MTTAQVDKSAEELDSENELNLFAPFKVTVSSVRPYWTKLTFISRTVAVTRFLAFQNDVAESVIMH